jgi:hypothetical protein
MCPRNGKRSLKIQWDCKSLNRVDPIKVAVGRGPCYRTGNPSTMPPLPSTQKARNRKIAGLSSMLNLTVTYRRSGG